MLSERNFHLFAAGVENWEKKLVRAYLKSEHIEGEALETSMDYHEEEECQTPGNGA